MSHDKAGEILRQGRWRLSSAIRSRTGALCCSLSQAADVKFEGNVRKGMEFVALQDGRIPQNRENVDRQPSDFMFREDDPGIDSRRS